MQSLKLLDRLIQFDTTSAKPNLSLITYLRDLLVDMGARVELIPDETGTKANLYATIGPTNRSGVLLSGHTDVVPVAGQNWTKPPFELTIEDGKAFGRGTADMKGFVACAMAAAASAAQLELQTPLHLAFSYDEEIGCVGVRSLIDMLRNAPFRPALCIVGEPTGLAVATGHKGKTAALLRCTGVEGHSALAPLALNAIHLASDAVSAIRRIQDDLASTGARDADYDVAYSTVHVGKINGGIALNIVPNYCEVEFEIRNIAADDPHAILDRLTADARAILAPHHVNFPNASIELEVINQYPVLHTPNSAEAVSFVKSLTGANGTIKVAFGTEGGLFSSELGIPTVVCGPGSMAQGHKPDEFVTLSQLDSCDAMLATLVNRLTTGL